MNVLWALLAVSQWDFSLDLSKKPTFLNLAVSVRAQEKRIGSKSSKWKKNTFIWSFLPWKNSEKFEQIFSISFELPGWHRVFFYLRVLLVAPVHRGASITRSLTNIPLFEHPSSPWWWPSINWKQDVHMVSRLQFHYWRHYWPFKNSCQHNITNKWDYPELKTTEFPSE